MESQNGANHYWFDFASGRNISNKNLIELLYVFYMLVVFTGIFENMCM